MRPILLAVVLLVPAVAHAEWGAHLDLGGGAGDGEAIVEVALRADYLFRGRTDGWGVGPAFELRSADLDTIEAGGGLAAYLPGGPLGLTLTGLGGVAGRGDGDDGLYLAGRLAFGLRLRDPSDRLAATTALYLDVRRGLGEGGATEVVGGLELGGAVFFALLRLAIGMGH